MRGGRGWWLVLAFAAACATPRPTVVVPGAAAEPVAPWVIPSSEDQTQRLLRADLDTAQGSARLRLTLRLSGADYELLAADALGRPVWTASVRGREALFLDHRESTWCEADSARPLAVLPLGGAPLVALPAVLLGRLPLSPEGEPEWRDNGVTYRTAGGGKLQAALEGEQLVRWTLFFGAEPAYWWARDDRGGVLTARREGIVLRWQEVVREPLRTPLGAPTPPPTYAHRDCDAAKAG